MSEIPVKDYGPTINQLLDAAFRELQHDTGPTNPEWHHSRDNLAKAFKKICGIRSVRANRPADQL